MLGVALPLSEGLAASWRHQLGHTSLMHGWLPTVAQIVTAVVLVLAVGWRTRRWRRLWLPVAIAVGAGLGWWTHWYVGSAGLAGEPAPPLLWVWIALTGVAAVTAVVGWRGTRWRRRTFSVLAVPASLLCAALSLNLWVGYFPTLHMAWSQFTAAPLPDQTDRAEVSAMQLTGTVPAKGAVVPVTISADGSKFAHRRELVYLPPAWFATNPPPALPAVMMIGAEFNTPTDWLRAGRAIETIDTFAAAHGGSAPVFVFVDSGGGFNIDTECVNGSRGNSADHLTKDVVPFLVSNFGVSRQRSSWGVAGFSAGGTCAIDLAVMNPDTFGAFVDISGDARPNAGTRDETVKRLFGGDDAKWSAFDPATVMAKHSPYSGVSGRFVISGTLADDHGGVTPTASPEGAAADSLCALGATRGIECAVVAVLGKHDWPFAARAFAASLPWLAGQLGTPGVPRTPLPSSSVASQLASTSMAGG